MSAQSVQVPIAALAASSGEEYVIGPETLGCCYRPSPFLADYLEWRSLSGFRAIPEVVDEYVEGLEKLAHRRPILRKTLLADSTSVISELVHLNSRCSRFIRAREKTLADPAVRRLLESRPSWLTQALVVAAAVEYNLPVLGFGSFYRAYAKHHPILAGVRDPRNGGWIIPPSR